MKRDRDAQWKVADFFVLRAAAAPLARFLAWGADVQAPAAAVGAARGEALDRDRARLAHRLRDVCADTGFREALFVASPTLEASLDQWLAGAESAGAQRTQRALTRYFARITGRAVPFGLFAGCAVGAIAARTRLELQPAGAGTRRTRLDVGYVEQLRLALEHDQDLRARLTFTPNSSLYRAADQIRWVEVRWNGRDRTHHLVSAPVSAPLEAVLARARGGALFDELTTALSEHNIDAAGARGYVDELIDTQLLVSDLELPVTGQEPLDALLDALHKVHCAETYPQLCALPDKLTQLDARGGAPPEGYRSIAAELQELPVAPELARTFQVDCRRAAADLTLGPDVVDELACAATLLERIMPTIDPLRAFREAFVARFDQQLVPLCEALDTDLGVGLQGTLSNGAAEPLLRGLPFSEAPATQVDWGGRERLLLAKIQRAAAAGDDEIALDDEDIRALEVTDPTPLGDGFAVLARLAAAGAEALDAGRFQLYVEAVTGPTGAELLGRFCYADPQLSAHVRTHLQALHARDSDAVYAEIAHLPEGRHGNVICRPVLSDWEIPYLTRAGVGPERRIPIDDLLVGVRRDEVVLVSRRLSRRVIPRMSCAHNYRSFGTPLYRFLCATRAHRDTGWLWSWGPLEDAPFLPRVRCGRVVLSLATWRLDAAEIRSLTAGDHCGRFDAVQRLRAERRLPRVVAHTQGDALLPVDLDNALCVDALGAALRDRDEARLVEMWPSQDRLAARDDNGALVSEMVVPFRGRGPSLQPKPLTSKEIRAGVDGEQAVRQFDPDGRWLYLKLYTPPSLADQVLDVAARAALATGAVERWFFIRYTDPAHHLRLRFSGDPGALRTQVLPAVQGAVVPLLRSGALHDLTIDQYRRELERYGGAAGIGLSEELFHADSTAVLDLLCRLEPGDAGHVERWQLALVGAAMLLDDFGLTGRSAIDLLAGLRGGFGAEFRADTRLSRALGERARTHRNLLTAVIDPDACGPPGLEPGVQILRQRSTALAPIVTDLHALEAAGKLSVPIAALVESYLHMHLNRMLRNAQRAQELVIYDFLLRAHRSAAARRGDLA